jgi:hypothetical protein
LIAAGDMKPSGLVEVERASQDGRAGAPLMIPRAVLLFRRISKVALNRNARAKRFFGALDGRNRYAVLFRIHTARKPDTRARRIRQFIAMMARGQKDLSLVGSPSCESHDRGDKPVLTKTSCYGALACSRITDHDHAFPQRVDCQMVRACLSPSVCPRPNESTRPARSTS